jgi:hypothetical protein
MVELKYGHLADYATLGANGKPILVGVFDRVLVTSSNKPILLPDFDLILSLSCSIADGAAHKLQLKLVDGNAVEVGAGFEADVTLHAAGPGYPLSGPLVLAVRGLTVPDHGDYQFVVRSDGAQIGTVDFVLSDAPKS